jgi:hypothetical protein
MTPAPARSHRRTHARRPAAPRRVSGPVSRRMVAAPAGAAALPRRGTTGIFARVRALPEHRVVDRLLRSRLWIWALGALLGGIVTMQVSLLKLNSGISRAVETTTTLERQNAALEGDIARLSSTDRIQTGAATLNMVLPDAGEVAYLTSGARDAARAVRDMQPPSEDAKALLANNGIVPGSLADQTVTTTTTTTVPPVTETVPPPVESTATTTTPSATEPVPVTTPAPSVAPPPTTTSQASPSGGAVVPQG